MPQHCLRVVRADHHEVEPADPVGHRPELDVACFAHRAGVERRDLGVVIVGRANEAGGVPDLGRVNARTVDTVALEPRAVVGEVLTYRTYQHG